MAREPGVSDDLSSGARRYRWAILAVGVVAQASFSALFFGLPVLAPALGEEYALGLGNVGVVLATVNVGMLFTVLPWGVLADRIGERAVMAVGLAIAAVALGGAAAAERFAGLVIALTLAGAFGACVQAASGRAVMGCSTFASAASRSASGRRPSRSAGRSRRPSFPPSPRAGASGRACSC